MQLRSPLTKRNIVTCYALRGDENCFCRVCYEVTVSQGGVGSRCEQAIEKRAEEER